MNGVRLTHTSYASFRRRMQLSEARLFVFVEGWTERYFYDGICNSLLSPRGIKYQLCPAHEISGQGGGKQALLVFYEYLDASRSLIDEFKGKRTGAIFFLDKDIDDLLNRCKSSEHIVYTEYYEVENYVVAYGDLVESTAAAAALDRESVRRGLAPGSDSWRRDAAANWKEWIKLCIFTQTRKMNHLCNYKVCSRINPAPYAPIDRTLHANWLADLERHSSLTSIDFKRVLRRISRTVERIYDENNHDLVFKGKWYFEFLAESVRRIAGSRPYNSNGLEDRLLACLQQSLNFQDTWTGRFKD